MKTVETSVRAAYPASPSCSCPICVGFCRRPGWWLVSEARRAIELGYARRMMLEFAPGFSFGVLSPAFKGNEGNFALQAHAASYCTFFEGGRCALYAASLQPIECKFCHHDRIGLGTKCHGEIERDWDSSKGRRLVRLWLSLCALTPPEFYRL